MYNTEDLYKVLLRPENPVFLSLFFTALIIIVLYFIYNYLIHPLNKKHKEELEVKQIKLMALFADLDPDPVLRVDDKGIVIYSNNAAKLIPEFSGMLGQDIKELLNSSDVDIPDLVKDNLNHVISTYINNKFYMINIKGNSYLNMGQIYFHDISETKKYEIKLRSSRRKLKSLTQHLLHLIEEERERISGELHDGIGQNLLFLQMKLQGMKEFHQEPEAHEALNPVITLLDDTVKDLRNIIFDLRPKILQEMGLVPAINYLCGQITSGGSIRGRVDSQGIEGRMEWKKEVLIFRIIQELLNNIVKHSEASQFDIQIFKKTNIIRIIVSDDGIGFNYAEIQKSRAASNKSGYGLFNLKERLSYLNGVLKIDSQINRGTIIIVEIPEGA